jgi:hypothetical protein
MDYEFIDVRRRNTDIATQQWSTVTCGIYMFAFAYFFAFHYPVIPFGGSIMRPRGRVAFFAISFSFRLKSDCPLCASNDHCVQPLSRQLLSIVFT